eukprot:m.127560 g.127560  ORF g.127560 m.127560 type:complete len:239 (+) comp14550_c0_seq2:125-841(+)
MAEYEEDYTLYYWPISFRGEFAKTIFAYTETKYHLASTPELMALYKAPTGADKPLCMAPPMLYDKTYDMYVSQLSAIVSHLGRKTNLIPNSDQLKTIAEKTVSDCNDVLSELTRNGGAKMWEDQAEFDEFLEGRFAKWLQIFEKTGARYGLKEDKGFFLGTEKATIADTSLVALLGNLEHCVPEFKPVLRKNCPNVMALIDRIKTNPGVAALYAEKKQTYCGGQIEASIRKVAAGIKQ